VDKLLVVELVKVKSVDMIIFWWCKRFIGLSAVIVVCFGIVVSLALIPKILFNKLLSKIIFSSLFRSLGVKIENTNAVLLFWIDNLFVMLFMDSTNEYESSSEFKVVIKLLEL